LFNNSKEYAIIKIKGDGKMGNGDFTWKDKSWECGDYLVHPTVDQPSTSEQPIQRSPKTIDTIDIGPYEINYFLSSDGEGNTIVTVYNCRDERVTQGKSKNKNKVWAAIEAFNEALGIDAITEKYREKEHGLLRRIAVVEIKPDNESDQIISGKSLLTKEPTNSHPERPFLDAYVHALFKMYNHKNMRN